MCPFLGDIQFDSARTPDPRARVVQFYLKENIFLHNFAPDLPARAAAPVQSSPTPRVPEVQR
jgi:hypothetical protein